MTFEVHTGLKTLLRWLEIIGGLLIVCHIVLEILINRIGSGIEKMFLVSDKKLLSSRGEGISTYRPPPP